jgi:hypothetical protein
MREEFPLRYVGSDLPASSHSTRTPVNLLTLNPPFGLITREIIIRRVELENIPFLFL